MSAIALNQVGQQTLEVGGEPVALSLPTYIDSDPNHPNGIERSMTPRHALIQVADNPVRWASGDGNLSDTFGQLLLPGDELDWLDPRRDYYGVISQVKFVTDATATGDAHVEVAFFA